MMGWQGRDLNYMIAMVSSKKGLVGAYKYAINVLSFDKNIPYKFLFDLFLC